MDVSVGSATVWVYALNGHAAYPGYQIQYDSIAQKWEKFPESSHPNYAGDLGVNSLQVTESGDDIVLNRESYQESDLWRGVNPF